MTTCLILMILATLACSTTCFAQWTKTIDCPPGRSYRDIRVDAGRQEFCEQILAGSLKVKDGPFRSWFSEGHPGSEGSYNQGREVGVWKECDRFDHCKTRMYKAIDGSEKQRGAFRPTVPLTYSHGKYIFDFGSCRSTWITYGQNDTEIHLNIGGMAPYRCEVSYIPQRTMEFGGEGIYVCMIPFSVGVRELKSPNVMDELPRLGLPRFCWPNRPQRGGFLISEKGSFVAGPVDVECATIHRNTSGPNIFTIRLNRYATDLVMDIKKKGGTNLALACLEEVRETGSSQDQSGRALFNFIFSDDPPKAKKQSRCITDVIKLQSTCQSKPLMQKSIHP